jgi:hypothetical protein
MAADRAARAFLRDAPLVLPTSRRHISMQLTRPPSPTPYNTRPPSYGVAVAHRPALLVTGIASSGWVHPCDGFDMITRSDRDDRPITRLIDASRPASDG